MQILHGIQSGVEKLCFTKKDRKTISLANPYTPNQLIVFDGKVPHTIKSQNLIGPSYRFTISLFFNKK